MEKNLPNTTFRVISLDTLGLSGTEKIQKRGIILKGQGSELNQPNYAQNRGKRKLIGATIALGLIDIAKAEGRDDLADSFWNTFHCQASLIVSKGKSYGNYCRNRFCPTCASIRKADTINRYRPIIQNWIKPYFVTLTVKSCKAEDLKRKLFRVKEVFEKIHKRLKQRHKRGKGIEIKGIRSIECNFNAQAKTYNPHIHLIVANEATANFIMTMWLKEWGVWQALGKNQTKTEITDLNHHLIEIIKYGTKFFTEPNPTEKHCKTPRDIYLRAMYNIIVVMRNMKQFSRFGFNLPKIGSDNPPASAVTIDYQYFDYSYEYRDWIDTETGNPLTGYSPTADLLDLLQNRVNINLR